MSYQPIENYGIIGNMRTVALIGMNGSIDWYCYPQFDSPGYHHLYRRIRCVRGAVHISISCLPAFDYGRQIHDTQIEDNGATFKSGRLSLALSTRDDGQGGGNFPQAFTHLALISAAFNLDRIWEARSEQDRSFDRAVGEVHAGSQARMHDR